MGYTTNYTLRIVGATEDGQKQIIAKLRQSCEEARHSIDEKGDHTSEARWYDHEKDLRAFTLATCGVIVQLDGEGEDSGDVWRKFFFAGKMQHAGPKFVYEDMNVSKME